MTTLSRRRLLQASATGSAALLLGSAPSALAAVTGVATGLAADPMGPGYWILMRDGRVLPRGSAVGDGRADAFSGVATGVAPHPTGGGFWRLRRDGRVAAFGRADVTAGPMADRQGRVVGVAANPRGTGLWRVTASGQVRATGTAEHLGGATQSTSAIAAIAAHPLWQGYWILNGDGRVFAFGASRVYGTPAGAGASGIAVHPSGRGYWVVKRNGNVGAYGAAAHHGNARLDSPIIDIAAAPDGAGYWVLSADARVRAFGSARDGDWVTGATPEPELATVGGIVVNATIARRVRALLGHAADDGVNLGGYGYRSTQRQIELREQNCGPRYYDVFVKSSSECSPMTAIPGRSLHERGLAIDFHRRLADGSTASIAGTRAFTWLDRNAKTYGLYNLPSEPWHWSTTGG